MLSLYADDTSAITTSDTATVAVFDTYAPFEAGNDKVKDYGWVHRVVAVTRLSPSTGHLLNFKCWASLLGTGVSMMPIGIETKKSPVLHIGEIECPI